MWTAEPQETGDVPGARMPEAAGGRFGTEKLFPGPSQEVEPPARLEAMP